MLPSLVATDLDGTFLGSDKRASQRNVDSFLRAAALGVPLVVATGRPARWLQVLDPLRPAHPFVIASNGAVVYDLAEGRIVERFDVPAEVALAVAEEVREACPDVHFAVEYGIGYGREAGYPLRGDFVEADHIGALDEILRAEPCVKLLVISERQDGDELARRLLPVIGHRLTTTWSFGGPVGLLEVSAPGVTKASTLRTLAAQLGVDLGRAVAFGDMPNDLDMLNSVGHPFAMADCHPLLREAGFTSAGDHDDSGVGRTLEALLNAG